MTILDIRNSTSTAVKKIRFADNHYAKACFITNSDDEIRYEDEDEDGMNYPLEIEDVDNFVKARAHARSLGWNI